MSVQWRGRESERDGNIIEGKGLPDLDIPCMEPLKISSIVINQGAGVAKIKAEFKNLEVYGLSNYTTTYARSDPENYRFTLGLKFRELKISGDYDISGNLLLIPISGHGTFWSLLNGVTADSYNLLEVKDKGLRLTKTQTDFDIGRMRVRLDNLFDGDKLLGMCKNFNSSILEALWIALAQLHLTESMSVKVHYPCDVDSKHIYFPFRNQGTL
ncbi:circadian clock-controlled protein daywake-like [Hetaerina americana]|uniref:circadian clock-controlled protein daywake-like n=1 Tax=Hetaerina americana TaxID=62018 RepID=UPI003A7F1213